MTTEIRTYTADETDDAIADAAAATLAAAVPLTQKGVAGGVSTLDAAGIIPLAQLPPSSPQAPSGNGTYLSQGGGVAFISGLTFRASAGVGYFNFARASWADTQITLTAADGSNPRIDTIVANSDGTVSAVAGTPAATPSQPDIDPLTQIPLRFIIVPAGASAIGITTVDLFKEGTEWTPSTNAPARVNVASSNNPYAGTKDIEFTSGQNGDYFRLTIPAGSQSLTTVKQLVLQLRSKGAWIAQKSFALTWYNGATKLGQAVTAQSAGFNTANTAGYQQVIIPIGLFAVPSTQSATILEGKVVGGGTSNAGVYVDNVVLESVSSATQEPQLITTASAGVAGLVFTDKTVQNPTVYVKESIDAKTAKLADLVFAFEFGDGVTTGSIAVNYAGDLTVPEDCTIFEARIWGSASQTGTVVDILRCLAANFPGAIAYASIAAAAKPTLTGVRGAKDITLTGWTVALSKGDNLQALLQSVDATAKKVNVMLLARRTIP